MKKPIIVLIIIFLTLVGCAKEEPATGGYGMSHAHDDTAGHLQSYGPGKAPHFHVPDPSKFERVEDIARDPSDIPKPINRSHSEKIKVELLAKEVFSEIAPGVNFQYWTFNGTVPGPLLRVREGDTVELTLANDPSSEHVHSIDLHAVTGPGGGAVDTQVAPGDNKSISFKALNPGLYVYHCATQNVPMHMANGMYGMILVEPEEGLSEVDREYYVMQGELYTKGKLAEQGFQEFSPQKMMDEDPEYVVWNGRINALGDHQLQANTGEKVRLLVGNGGVSLISSFHVIGEIFDKVYLEASTSEPRENIQTTLVPAGGASITEMEVEVPGNYILVDHSLARLDRGAWGVLRVKGNEDPDVYKALQK